MAARWAAPQARDFRPSGYSANPGFSTLNSGVTPGFYWDSGFPAYAHPPFFNPTLNAGFTTTTPTGFGATYADPVLSGIPSRTENWNFTVERELSLSTVVKASYSGSGSHFLPTGIGNGMWSD